MNRTDSATFRAGRIQFALLQFFFNPFYNLNCSARERAPSYSICPKWIQLGHFRPLLAMAEWDFSIQQAALPLGKNWRKWPTNRPPGNPALCYSRFRVDRKSVNLVALYLNK
jgi:hypothetical protein